jgi:hypothetical protein
LSGILLPRFIPMPYPASHGLCRAKPLFGFCEGLSLYDLDYRL